MAGLLNILQPPLFRSLPGRRKTPHTSFSVKATSETPVNPSSSTTTTKQVPFAAPPNFKPPEPKRFSVRPDKIFDILGASLSLVFRLGTGVFVSGYSASLVGKDEIPPDQYALEIAGFKVKETSKLGPRPEKPIEIYEFESCPFCRKVRELVSVLDLDVLYYPCPRNGPNFRLKVSQMGGKQQFPYMVDPNTGVSMYESDEIIKYLVGKYGDGSVPFMLSLGLLTTLTEGFAMIGRMGRGSSYTPSKLPPKPLEVWAYEGSPFCKVVREVLVELELPHIFRSTIYSTATANRTIACCFCFSGATSASTATAVVTNLSEETSDVSIHVVPPPPRTLPPVYSHDSSLKIEIKLDGSNYPLWSKFVEIFVAGKDKYGFLTEDNTKPAITCPTYRRCCARGSPKRQILYQKANHFQVPYLEDPNTGVQMFESAEIVEYLRATYVR